jgi:hypothetical protein
LRIVEGYVFYPSTARHRFSTSWHSRSSLHDLVDATRRIVLTVVVEATSEFPLLALAVTLVDVAVGVAIASVFVEVGA